jgi:hypothetical protein
MKGTLTLERRTKSGLIIARHKQPMRSWTLPLFQALYAQFSAINAPNVNYPSKEQGIIATGTINTGALIGGGGSPLWGHQVPGNAGAGHLYDGYIPHDMLGIQVGIGNTAVDSADFALDEKLCPTFSEPVRSWDAPNTDPWGICFDGTWIYIADMTAQQIYQCDRLTGAVNANWASPGGGGVFPYCITYDPVSGHLFVGCDDNNVYEITTAGAPIGNWGYPAGTPYGACYDSVTGDLFFCDSLSNVRQITTAGVPVANWAHGHGGNIYGIAYDSINDLLILLEATAPARFYLMTKAGVDVSGPWYIQAFRDPYGCCFDGHYLWMIDTNRDSIHQVCIFPDNFQYGGQEIVDLAVADPNAQFTLRRFFTNMTGGNIDIEEVGIWMEASDTVDTYEVVQIARDVVAPAVTVLNTELLRVTYDATITV